MLSLRRLRRFVAAAHGISKEVYMFIRRVLFRTATAALGLSMCFISSASADALVSYSVPSSGMNAKGEQIPQQTSVLTMTTITTVTLTATSTVTTLTTVTT